MLVTTLYHQQVTILNACDKPHPVVAQLFVQGFYQDVTFFCGKVSTMMILYRSIGKGDDVTSDCHIVSFHLVSNACSLKRSASFIDLVKVVPHDCSICHLASRTVTIGHSDQPSCLAFLCEHIHIRSVGKLQQCLASKPLHWMVSHSVTKNDYVFHKPYR